MASVALTQFLPEVSPECPGAPELVAVNAIRNAAFDFCNKALVWSADATPVTIMAGTATYTVPTVTDAQVVAIPHVTLGTGRVVYPVLFEDVVAAFPAWSTKQGPIAAYFMPNPDVVTFVMVPEADAAFTPYVAYAPKRNATVVDDRLYNIYLEAIKYGALWKLKSMFGTAWADPPGAAYYERQFWMAVNAAVLERLGGFAAVEQRILQRPAA